jgi:hypothetical protein
MRSQDHEGLFHLLMKLLITEYCKIIYPEIAELVKKAEFKQSEVKIEKSGQHKQNRLPPIVK